MIRRALIGTVLLVFVTTPAKAQFAVIDPANLAQAILIVQRTQRHYEELRAQYRTIVQMAQGLGRMDQYRTPASSLTRHDEGRWTYGRPWLAANTSMRGVEVKHVRRKDFDPEKRLIHIRTSKNQTSKRVIPLNDSAFDAVQRMVKRSDVLGHSEPEHYLWCASQHHKLDPTKPASKWDTAWRALRAAAGLPGLRFHDLRHQAATDLLTLGADASVATGPVGRQGSAATDMNFNAEIYSYARTRGLFGGIALDGSVISIDKSANAALYGKGGVTATEIFSGQAPAAPATAQRFLERLAQATRTAVRSSPAPQADTPAASTIQSPAGTPPSADAPRTYPLEENR